MWMFRQAAFGRFHRHGIKGCQGAAGQGAEGEAKNGDEQQEFHEVKWVWMTVSHCGGKTPAFSLAEGRQRAVISGGAAEVRERQAVRR